MVCDDEDKNETEDEIAHQLPVALAGADHVIDSVHAAAQQPRRAVKLHILKQAQKPMLIGEPQITDLVSRASGHHLDTQTLKNHPSRREYFFNNSISGI